MARDSSGDKVLAWLAGGRPSRPPQRRELRNAATGLSLFAGQRTVTSVRQSSSLTGGEAALLGAIEAGTPADLRIGDPDRDDPRRGVSWGVDRTVRAAFLRSHLLSSRDAAVVLCGAKIAGDLNLELATIGCAIVLHGCYFDAPISLRDASIPLARFTDCMFGCMAADMLRTRGDFDLAGSTGSIVILRGARLGGSLVLRGSELSGGDCPPDLGDAALRLAADQYDHETNVALAAQGLRTDQDIRMDDLVAAGCVQLRGAHVSGQLVLRGARLAPDRGPALTADRLTVDQSMFCHQGFQAEGEVCLIGARIGSQLIFDRGSVDVGDASATALDLYEATVAGSLSLRFIEPPVGVVNLRQASVGALLDSEQAWPAGLSLRGFTYSDLRGSLGPPDAREARPASQGDLDVTCRARLRWVSRDPQGYAPQPYEQLVSFYRRTGREQDARRVAIEKQRRRREHLSGTAAVWNRTLGLTVGYGYRPWLAGVWLVVLVAVGWGVFQFVFPYPKYFTPAREYGGSPPFQPLLYSLDLVIPIVNLHQRDAWNAVGAAQWGVLLTIAGWLLATVWVAALAGLLKKD